MKRIKLLVLFLAMFMPMMVNADPVEIDGIYYNLISKGNIAEVTQKNDISFCYNQYDQNQDRTNNSEYCAYCCKDICILICFHECNLV